MIKEHEDNILTKTDEDEIKKYLKRIFQRFFEQENINSIESREAMIVEAIRRYKEFCKSKGKDWLIGINDMTGIVYLSASVLGGELTIRNKRTAFNKDFGDEGGTICEGNDPRLSDARTPTEHTHLIQDVEDLESELNKLKAFRRYYCHNHVNLNILNKIIYTGPRDILDLIFLEQFANSIRSYIAQILNKQYEIDELCRKYNAIFSTILKSIKDRIETVERDIPDMLTWSDGGYAYVKKTLSIFPFNNKYWTRENFFVKDDTAIIKQNLLDANRYLYTGEIPLENFGATRIDVDQRWEWIPFTSHGETPMDMFNNCTPTGGTWIWDSEKGIVQEDNTDNMVRYISNDYYKTYTHRVTVNSDAEHGDLISVLIAEKDGSTLEALVWTKNEPGWISLGNEGPGVYFGIGANYTGIDTVTANTNLLFCQKINNDPKWWSEINGVTIVIRRDMEKIEVWFRYDDDSSWSTPDVDPTEPPDYTLVFASSPDTAIFDNTLVRYGYSNHSQMDSYYENVWFYGEGERLQELIDAFFITRTHRQIYNLPQAVVNLFQNETVLTDKFVKTYFRWERTTMTQDYEEDDDYVTIPVEQTEDEGNNSEANIQETPESIPMPTEEIPFELPTPVDELEIEETESNNSNAASQVVINYSTPANDPEPAPSRPIVSEINTHEQTMPFVYRVSDATYLTIQCSWNELNQFIIESYTKVVFPKLYYICEDYYIVDIEAERRDSYQVKDKVMEYLSKLYNVTEDKLKEVLDHCKMNQRYYVDGEYYKKPGVYYDWYGDQITFPDYSKWEWDRDILFVQRESYLEPIIQEVIETREESVFLGDYHFDADTYESGDRSVLTFIAKATMMGIMCPITMSNGHFFGFSITDTTTGQVWDSGGIATHSDTEPLTHTAGPLDIIEGHEYVIVTRECMYGEGAGGFHYTIDLPIPATRIIKEKVQKITGYRRITNDLKEDGIPSESYSWVAEYQPELILRSKFMNPRIYYQIFDTKRPPDKKYFLILIAKNAEDMSIITYHDLSITNQDGSGKVVINSGEDGQSKFKVQPNKTYIASIEPFGYEEIHVPIYIAEDTSELRNIYIYYELFVTEIRIPYTINFDYTYSRLWEIEAGNLVLQGPIENEDVTLYYTNSGVTTLYDSIFPNGKINTGTGVVTLNLDENPDNLTLYIDDTDTYKYPAYHQLSLVNNPYEAWFFKMPPYISLKMHFYWTPSKITRADIGPMSNEYIEIFKLSRAEYESTGFEINTSNILDSWYIQLDGSGNTIFDMYPDYASFVYIIMRATIYHWSDINSDEILEYVFPTTAPDDTFMFNMYQAQHPNDPTYFDMKLCFVKSNPSNTKLYKIRVHENAEPYDTPGYYTNDENKTFIGLIPNDLFTIYKFQYNSATGESTTTTLGVYRTNSNGIIEVTLPELANTSAECYGICSYHMPWLYYFIDRNGNRKYANYGRLLRTGDYYYENNYTWYASFYRQEVVQDPVDPDDPNPPSPPPEPGPDPIPKPPTPPPDPPSPPGPGPEPDPDPPGPGPNPDPDDPVDDTLPNFNLLDEEEDYTQSPTYQNILRYRWGYISIENNVVRRTLYHRFYNTMKTNGGNHRVEVMSGDTFTGTYKYFKGTKTYPNIDIYHAALVGAVPVDGYNETVLQVYCEDIGAPNSDEVRYIHSIVDTDNPELLGRFGWTLGIGQSILLPRFTDAERNSMLADMEKSWSDIKEIISTNTTTPIHDVDEYPNQQERLDANAVDTYDGVEGHYYKQQYLLFSHIVHDFIVTHTRYGIANESYHSAKQKRFLYNQIAWPALSQKTYDDALPVCASYARAFKYIMNKIGFGCITPTGPVDHQGPNASIEPHQWAFANYATAYEGDSDPYHWSECDLTWDDRSFDRGSELEGYSNPYPWLEEKYAFCYAYLNVTTQELNTTKHIKLCNSNYFCNNGEDVLSLIETDMGGDTRYRGIWGVPDIAGNTQGAYESFPIGDCLASNGELKIGYSEQYHYYEPYHLTEDQVDINVFAPPTDNSGGGS